MLRKRLLVTSAISLTAKQSKEEASHITRNNLHRNESTASVCYRYYHSKNVPTACKPDNQLSLEFSHDDDSSYSKENVREFWQLLDQTVCLQKREIYTKKRKRKKSARKVKNTLNKEIKSILSTPPAGSRASATSHSTSTEQETVESNGIMFEDPPTLAVLKMLMERGVDEAALAIRTNYPLEPPVCTCGQKCCLCIMFSPHWDGARRTFERQRQRLLRQGKLKLGDDPLPVNTRHTIVAVDSPVEGKKHEVSSPHELINKIRGCGFTG
ncbi:uncharacterized protein [Halyomorpha halys]|uniref:uncharacterized protein isoform X2 n=1 Tax=Halyomorpha halys TaxID=286706 RepID=UPI0006D50B7B|nr:uncharacterized protein LOC106688130 isoform X2 [Halyomorpha halys]